MKDILRAAGYSEYEIEAYIDNLDHVNGDFMVSMFRDFRGENSNE